MGTRKMRERQPDLWYGVELPTAPGHPFYKRLNEVLDNAQFDTFCETSCADFYHQKLGRPSLPPGQYFRIMMIGFFEGLDSEREAWARVEPVQSVCKGRIGLSSSDKFGDDPPGRRLGHQVDEGSQLSPEIVDDVA